MRSEPRSWRDVGCHFTDKIELPIRAFCQQGVNQVLQCNYANPQLHQLGVGQRRDLGLSCGGTYALLMAAESCAAFIVPPR